MSLRLCRAEDIPEGASRGFDLPGCRLMGVKQYGKVYLYLNRCPHLGTPLEWERDRFLDNGGAYIRCSNHGALFIKESGECVQGPCLGEFLWEIPHRVEEGDILIDDDELPLAG